jgi:hypothetical protein
MESMKDRRIALGLSCAMHGAVLALVAASMPSAHVVRVPTNSSTELDVEVESVLQAPPASSEARSGTPDAPARGEPRAPIPRPSSELWQGRSRAVATAPPMSRGDSTGGAAVERTGASTDGWSFSPLRSGNGDVAGTGFGARTGTLGTTPATVDPSPGEAAPRPSLGLVEALDAADRSLGLSRAGPLLAAAEDATREAGPDDGHATLEVCVDTGRHASVAVASVSANLAAWEVVARLLEGKAREKPLRIPPTARGLCATIALETAIRWPDGQRVADTQKGIEGKLTGPRGADGNTLSVPEASLRASGKVCHGLVRTPGARIADGRIEILPLLEGGCSVENIGSAGQRVVHGRVVAERRL